MTASRIFIVEDHPKMRETYALFIERTPDMEVVGLVATGAEALAQIAAAQPDIALVDLSLPDIDGVELVQRLRAQFPTLPILVVSGYHANQFAGRISNIGANGFLNKQSAYKKLIPLIREILTKASNRSAHA